MSDSQKIKQVLKDQEQRSDHNAAVLLASGDYDISLEERLALRAARVKAWERTVK